MEMRYGRSGNIKQRAAAVSAIRELAGRLDPEGDSDEVFAVTREIMTYSAFLSAATPIGTCERDGTDLFYKSGDRGLLVCCANGHCWKLAAEEIDSES